MVEGACDNSDLATLNFFITLSPSPSFVGSSLPEGAFVTAPDRKTKGRMKPSFGCGQRNAQTKPPSGREGDHEVVEGARVSLNMY